MARRRLERGARLWVARGNGSPAHSCWLFRGALPFRAARRGELALPDDTLAIEQVFTAPGHRGRGLASAAFATCAEAAALEDGLERLVMPVEEANMPARRAAEKAGFRELARTTVIRRLTALRCEVEPRTARTEFLMRGLLRTD